MKRPDYQWFTLGEAARRVTISSADELSAWLTAQRQSGAALDQDAIKQIEDAFDRAPERVELFTLEEIEPTTHDASSLALRSSMRSTMHERGRWAVFTLAGQWVGGSQPQGLTELELSSYLRSLRWAAAAWVIARGGDELSLSWVGDAQLTAQLTAPTQRVSSEGQADEPTLLTWLNLDLSEASRERALSDPSRAPRVATLAPSNLEIIEALGALEMIVACEESSDLPKDWSGDVARLGPDLNPDLDALTARQPDLTISSLSVPGMERVITGLARRGLAQLALAPRSLDQVIGDISSVAARLGLEAQGAEVVERLRREREALTQLRNFPPARVYLEWWPKPMFTPGARCFSNELIALAGGVNVFGDREGSSVEISAQELIEAAPEVCFISWCGAPLEKLNPENLRRRAGLEELNESARRWVIPIDEAYTGRPGPRMLEASRQMARAIQALRGHEA